MIKVKLHPKSVQHYNPCMKVFFLSLAGGSPASLKLFCLFVRSSLDSQQLPSGVWALTLSNFMTCYLRVRKASFECFSQLPFTLKLKLEVMIVKEGHLNRVNLYHFSLCFKSFLFISRGVILHCFLSLPFLSPECRFKLYRKINVYF